MVAVAIKIQTNETSEAANGELPRALMENLLPGEAGFFETSGQEVKERARQCPTDARNYQRICEMSLRREKGEGRETLVLAPWMKEPRS